MPDVDILVNNAGLALGVASAIEMLGFMKVYDIWGGV